MSQILCVGMSALDAIYHVPAIPTRPTKVLATAFEECGGGMAANASVAVARLGGRSTYWGRVGSDEVGTRILDELAAEGVDITAVRRISGCVSPSAAILVADDGERLICAYNDPRLDPGADWLPLEQVSECAAVLVDVRWPTASALVLDRARRAGIPAVLDGDVGPPDAVRELMRLATHVVFSEPGLALVAETDDPQEGLASIAAKLDAVVGVTLGPAGFVWSDRGTSRRVAAPAIEAIDTLAAGDVWHGAFALALAERRPIPEAARFANAAAAIKCTRTGGRRGAPRRDEVMQWLNRSW